MLEEAAAVRRKKAEMGATKVSQKVVHGDEVTTTTIRDSVVSKSNVGGGSSKMQELKELTEMKEKGLIDDDEFKQMKKEILGK
ncbi:MAG: SHOCT domain-containing protein [Candidatus Poseidoniia archaeon]|nr:SHOCT domain-containing protein [Candidatus Poseidoniia archaeon]